jgi:hypothetical protein
VRHRLAWVLGSFVLATGCLGDEFNDLAAPVVVIVSPAANATLSGSVTVEVQAADDTGVEAVTLLIDGVVLEKLFSAPYNFTWPTQQWSNGPHTLRAVAEDRVGNRALVERTVTVDNRPS